MQYRILGSTGIQVSALAFGAGPVPAVMTGTDSDGQIEVVKRALEVGVNWFDTSATYGGGQSEQSLGDAFRRLGVGSEIHVATKVRFMPEDLGDIPGHVRRSFEGSLSRLGLSRVTLLQLHNSVTANRGDEPTSITPEDVLGPGGILGAFEELRRQGRVDHLGITGIGLSSALREVIRSGEFQTMQTPYNPLNPSAGQTMGDGFAEVFRPPLLWYTLIGICLGAIPLLGNWGGANWLVLWAGKAGGAADPALKAWAQWTKSGGAAVGSLLGGWLASQFGRRTTYFIISLCALSTAMYLFWFLSPLDPHFLLWVFVMGFFATVYFGWLPLYLPELFPVHVRSTGTGVTFNFGRIATALGVLGTGQLMLWFDGDYAMAGRVTCLVYLLGMVIVFFAPDTSRKQL